ncbi:glycosyltransferase family 2 protein [Candidatus Woesearchaeota archaeon]|nr:glycosyltransferase family 2 protein [Candidatus Woesearchaeota archaeon]
MVQQKNVWAIIPAFNEGKNIAKVIRATKKLIDKGIVSHIVVVDDGSKDDTAAVAEEAGADVLGHVINLGKGAALKTGCEYAYRHGCEFFVLMDGDCQHSPEKIPVLLKKLKENDIVFTYRKFDKNMPIVLKMGNILITRFINFLYKVNVYDPLSGFRAFTRKSYKKISWNSNNYSVESEIIARVGKNNLKYTQIPICTVYLDRYKGTTFLHGVKIFMDMVSWKIRR